MLCGFILHAFKNYRCFAHRSADKPLLPGKRGRCAFPHDPKLLALMRFAPRKIVVVMHLCNDPRAKNSRHALTHPVAPRIGVRSRKMHAFDVLRAKISRSRYYAWLDVHAIFRASLLQEPRCDFVTQSAGTEVYANPHAVLLVSEEIDVMISGPYCAELLTSHLLERRSRLRLPRIAFEQRMFHAFVVSAAHAKADRVPHVVHNALDVCAQFLTWQVYEDSFIAARDIVANTRRADGVLVCHDTADGNRIAFVMIRHQRHFVCGTRARFDLRERALFRITPHRDAINELHFFARGRCWAWSRAC